MERKEWTTQITTSKKNKDLYGTEEAIFRIERHVTLVKHKKAILLKIKLIKYDNNYYYF